MDWMSDKMLRVAAKYFVVANTPMFLFDRLRQDPVLQQAAAISPTEELVESHNLAVTGFGENPDLALAAYAVVAALSLKPGLNLSALGQSIRSDTRIQWLEELHRYLIGTYSDAQRVVVRVPPAAAQIVQPTIASTSSTSEFSIAGQPNV